MSEDTPDADTILTRLGQKLTGDDGESTDEQDTGDGSDTDAGQKQPPEGDDGGDEDGDAVDELVAALADEMGVSPEAVMDALGQVGQNADDEDDDEDDDDDDDGDDGMKAGDDDTASVSIDFEQKMAEHGVVTEDDLSDLRESIVDDIGEKLAESNQEAVEEIAQKMSEGSTPNPAGGSYQDSEDFEAHLEEVADGEDW